MATFADMYDYVLPEIRSVETPTVDFYIRSVTRDFLKATSLWRESLVVPISIGLTAYRLRPRNGGQVAGVLGVTFGERAVVNLDERSQPGPNAVLDAGDPDGWWQVYPGVINLRRPPGAAGAINVKVFKQLTLDPSDDIIPDEAFDNYVEELAAGVKSRLQAMPAKPWSDTTMATVNNAFYTKAKFGLRAQLRNGGAAGHSTVVAPRFAGR